MPAHGGRMINATDVDWADTASFSALSTSSDFKRTTSGRILADNLDNIRLALKKLGTTLSYDMFARTILVDGAVPDDMTTDQLWVAIDDTVHFRPAKGTLRTVILE